MTDLQEHYKEFIVVEYKIKFEAFTSHLDVAVSWASFQRLLTSFLTPCANSVIAVCSFFFDSYFYYSNALNYLYFYFLYLFFFFFFFFSFISFNKTNFNSLEWLLGQDFTYFIEIKNNWSLFIYFLKNY